MGCTGCCARVVAIDRAYFPVCRTVFIRERVVWMVQEHQSPDTTPTGFAYEYQSNLIRSSVQTTHAPLYSYRHVKPNRERKLWRVPSMLVWLPGKVVVLEPPLTLVDWHVVE